MTLQEIRKPLFRLLELVVNQIGTEPGVDQIGVPRLHNFFPSDLLTSDTYVRSGGKLWLVGDACRSFTHVQSRLKKEIEDGELEHGSHKEIERQFWRLVCEVWCSRSEMTSSKLRERAENFLAANQQSQVMWDVIWEISDLTVDDKLLVAGVQFFAFQGEGAAGWRSSGDSFWRTVEDEHLIGRTFALANAKANCPEKALERAKQAIDDALNLLRVALLSVHGVPDRQCLQRRGLHFYAKLSTAAGPSRYGGESGYVSYELGIGGELLEFISGRLSELAPSFDKTIPERLREPLFRALMWIGSSVTRESLDDKVVDLCTGLESLLTLEGDVRKAETIAVRYMLLGFAIDDPSYVTHPFAIYDLYKLRNKIVHGSARRVCDERSHQDLNYVALDAVNRTMKLISTTPKLTRQTDLFEVLETKTYLEKVKKFLDGYGDSKRESIEAIRGLLNTWISRAPLREIAKESKWIVQWKHEVRTTVRFSPKGNVVKSPATSAQSFAVSGWDPLKVDRNALALFEYYLDQSTQPS